MAATSGGVPARPGPTLLIMAGVHGNEFESIAALHDFFHALRPAQLRGKVVAVSVAHLDAFEAHDRVGTDGINLARVFLGLGRIVASYYCSPALHQTH